MGKNESYIVAILLYAGILNMRPAILGQLQGELFVLIIGLLFLQHIFVKDFRIKVTKASTQLILFFLATSAYYLIQSIILNPSQLVDIVKIVIFMSIGILPVLTSRPIDWKLPLKAMIYLCIPLSISYFISYSILILSNFNFDITLFDYYLPMGEDFSYSQSVLFPFSPVYSTLDTTVGTIRIGDVRIARAIGFFREPGIFQVALNISFFGLDYINIKYKNYLKFFILFTLIFTFSTAGFGIFIIVYLTKYLMAIKRSNLWSSVVVLSVALVVLFFFLTLDVNFSLLSKLNTRSGSERLVRFLLSLQLLMDHWVFGVGLRKDLPFEDINFITTVVEIGFVGLIVVLAPYIYLIVGFLKKKRTEFLLLIPLILTLILSQPLFDKSLSYYILSFSFLSLNYENEVS